MSKSKENNLFKKKMFGEKNIDENSFFSFYQI